MASVGTLVASGGTSAVTSTLVLTCSASPSADEHVHLFWLTDHFGTPLKQSQVLSAVDSRGGTWKLSTTTTEGGALVGQTDEIDASTHWYLIGSFIRTAGDPLQAGDTITLTFVNNTSHPLPTHAAALVQGFLGVTDNAVAQNVGDYGSTVDISSSATFVAYNNGDSTISGPPNQLLWRVDYAGLQQNPAPAVECAFIGVFASLNGSGFTPEQLGTRVAQVTQGPMYLAVSFAPSVAATGACLEPGGTFSGASSTVGNYQFVGLVPVTGTVVKIHLEDVSYRVGA